MADIQAGTYTVQEVLDKAGFDFKEKAAADYLNGEPDHRRVRVGGLSFDDPNETVTVPTTADELVVTLDGKEHATLKVTLDDDQKEERRRSFDSAADASEPGKSTTK